MVVLEPDIPSPLYHDLLVIASRHDLVPWPDPYDRS